MPKFIETVTLSVAMGLLCAVLASSLARAESIPPMACVCDDDCQPYGAPVCNYGYCSWSGSGTPCTDGGPPDPDLGPDLGAPDIGPPDLPRPDTMLPDVLPPDLPATDRPMALDSAPLRDLGQPALDMGVDDDGAVADAGAMDGAGSNDKGPSPKDSGSGGPAPSDRGGCSVTSPARGAAAWPWALTFLLVLIARRRLR